MSKNGGPAFPSQQLGTDGLPDGEMVRGLTVRDWFAGQVLASMEPKWDGAFSEMDRRDGLPETYAKWHATTAYRIADAMLAHREREES